MATEFSQFQRRHLLEHFEPAEPSEPQAHAEPESRPQAEPHAAPVGPEPAAAQPEPASLLLRLPAAPLAPDYVAVGEPVMASVLDELPQAHFQFTAQATVAANDPPALTAVSSPVPPQPPAATAYVGEPAVGGDWLAAREAALTAVRGDYEAQRGQAQASAGSGPGWVEAAMVTDESGRLVSASGAPTVFIADPGAAPQVIGYDEGGPVYGGVPGRHLDFSEEAFAAHYRAQGSAQPGTPLQTLAGLYDTDAATLLARHPGIWGLATSEHALNAGPAPAGRAMGDPAQLAMLDLYMADPQVADLIQRYGGSVAPATSGIALEQVRIHGQVRYEQMTRLANAMQAVRSDYAGAMQQAMAQGGPGWVEQPRMVTTHDESGVVRTEPVVARDESGAATVVTERFFDPDRFTAWYLQQPGAANQAFAGFYGQSHTQWSTDESGARVVAGIEFDNPSWQMGGPGGPMAHRDFVSLDPNHAPRLNDDSAVGFDLVNGWSTHHSNIYEKQSFFDKAFPIILIAAVAWFSAGTLGPSAAAGMGMTTTATVGGVTATTLTSTGFIVSAEVAGAATSVASGIVSGNLEFKNILRGALSSAVTAGLMQGAVAAFPAVQNVGTAANVLGRMTVGGAVQLLMGGSLRDGMLSGLASGLSSALGEHLSGQIATAGLQGAERFAALTASKVLTSAVIALGNPDDPRHAFAHAFMDSVFQELPTPSVAQLIARSVIDENGEVRSGVLPDDLPAGQKLAQLTQLLQDKGLNEGEAWRASLGALSVGIGAPGASGNLAGTPWGDNSAQQQQTQARADLAGAAFDQLEQRYGSQQAIPAGELKFVLNTVLGANALSADMAARLPLLEPIVVAGPSEGLGAGAVRQTATAAGVIAGLFQGVGDSVIGLAGMAKTLFNANLYVLGGGENGVGRLVPGGRQAMQDLTAMSDSVQAMLREPLAFLGAAVNQRTQAALGALNTAEASGNAGDWFLYGAEVGRSVFDVATLVLGAPAAAGSAAAVGAKLRAYVDAVQAGRTVENAVDLSRSGIGAVQDLTAATVSPAGNLSAGSINRAAYALTDLVPAERNLALDIMVNGDNVPGSAGRKTEQLTSMIAQRQGWNELPGGKYGGGSDNGFDHVLQGPDGKVTIVLDSKQINDGATQLGTIGDGTVVQLSDRWINNVLDKLPDNSPAKVAVLRAIDEGTLFKGMMGVDKATGQVTLIRVNP